MAVEPALKINGRTILLHPLLTHQIAFTVAEVQRAQARDPATCAKKNSAKRLKAILKLAFEDVPADPSNTAYRLGSTLGPVYSHWFRAKFFQQYRLFFRFNDRKKIIIYAWMNDESTKRAYGSRTDAYAVFSSMLQSRDPPDDWAALKLACEQEDLRRQGAGEGHPAVLARALLDED